MEMQQGQQQQQQKRNNSLWQKGTEKVKETRPERLLTCMRVFNIIMSLAVITAACSTIASLSGCTDNCSKTSFGVVAFFSLTFAILLLLFELRAGDKSKTFLEKNFGFLYAHRGKALLIIFIGTLAFSSISTSLDRWAWNVVVGIAVTLNGLFLCAVYYLHPSFKEVDLRPGSKGLGGVQKHSGTNGSNVGGTTAQAVTGSSSDYQYGEANLGPAYGRYNESPFTITENAAQPPPIEQNPYASSVNTTGMPFATDNNTTTIEFNASMPSQSAYDTRSGTNQSTPFQQSSSTQAYSTSGNQTSSEPNPFPEDENPFAEDTEQRV